MGRTTYNWSVKTREELQLFHDIAESKGLKLAAYLKMLIYRDNPGIKNEENGEDR